MKQIVLAMVFVMLAGAMAQATSVPPLVNYQGMLADADGKPLTGTKKIEFSLYDAAMGGNKVWGPQVFDSVPLVNGMFNVILSVAEDGKSSIAEAFGAKDRYLGIKVGDEAELAPRQQILSAPFAINAENAKNADNAENARNADNANLLQNKDLDELTSAFREPDYDSEWFDVEVGNTYEKEIGFTGLPKFITAYYKRPNGQVLLWGMTEFSLYSGGSYWMSGILLDFDENGFLYVRTPSGNTYNRLLNLVNYRNRGNDGNESINENENVVQFKVLLWK